ncbi:MAG TPA: hypothetical protein DIW31_12175 [Bacteroidales bacterium]|nr:hypothetical protein [Bacteroidales bacterium]
MRYLLKIAFVILILFNAQKGWSQATQVKPQQLIAEIIEEMSAKSENDIDFTPIIEDLTNLLENPININQCSLDDLSKLIFLSDFQIKGLWDYIQEKGPILSIYELQMVYGFEKGDIERLVPFVTLEKPVEINSFKSLIAFGHHEISTKIGSVLEHQDGYQTPDNPSASHYLGSKYSTYTRYSFQSKDKLEWGLIADKDAGEEFFKGSNSNGFDYLSGYVAVSNMRPIKKLVVGDFDAEFGQGLTFWSSVSAGKSSDPLGIRKRARGLRKHSSTNENNFLRGAGVTIPISKIDVTLFGSYKNIDASLGDSLIDGEPFYTSMPISGFHRTPTEIANKDLISEMIAGGNIMFKGKKIKAGLTLSHIKIDGNFTVDSSLNKLYEPSMNGRTNVGLNLDGFLRNHHLFGEAAIETSTKEHALIAGGLFKLSSLVDFSLLVRSYSRGYTNQYTSGFAEGSGTYNENGVMTGLSVLPAKGLKLSGYIDVFVFPWLKYRVDAPSTGYEYLLQADYRISSNLMSQIRYRYKNSELNFVSSFSKVDFVIPQQSQAARIQFIYTPDKQVKLKSRFDLSSFRNDSTQREQGYAFSQDIEYDHPRLPFSVACRFAIFDTDSWNTRIYCYESDMPYSYSVPAYYSKGTRVYLMLKYSPSRSIDCWLRWSQTYYSDLKEIGQGLDLIHGNKKSDIRIMVKVRF